MKDYINIKSRGWSVRVDLDGIHRGSCVSTLIRDIRDRVNNWEAFQIGDDFVYDCGTASIRCISKDPHTRIIGFKEVGENA